MELFRFNVQSGELKFEFPVDETAAAQFKMVLTRFHLQSVVFKAVHAKFKTQNIANR